MSDDIYYDGPVCYVDGWHFTVVPNHDGVGNGDFGHVYEIPGRRLVCEDTADGSLFRYRPATDADTRSWHERKHRQFITVEPADGQPGVSVTADELEAVKKLLADLRGGS